MISESSRMYLHLEKKEVNGFNSRLLISIILPISLLPQLLTLLQQPIDYFDDEIPWH